MASKKAQEKVKKNKGLLGRAARGLGGRQARLEEAERRAMGGGKKKKVRGVTVPGAKHRNE